MRLTTASPPPPPPDVLPPHPLHPPGAPEEGALLHGAADGPAGGAVCFRDVPAPLHEDGVPPAHDPARPRQVNTGTHTRTQHTNTQTHKHTNTQHTDTHGGHCKHRPPPRTHTHTPATRQGTVDRSGPLGTF